jgi:hypothetical protein
LAENGTSKDCNFSTFVRVRKIEKMKKRRSDGENVELTPKHLDARDKGCFSLHTLIFLPFTLLVRYDGKKTGYSQICTIRLKNCFAP